MKIPAIFGLALLLSLPAFANKLPSKPGKAAEARCQAALKRYSESDPALLARCKQANTHSARVIDTFSKAYPLKTMEEWMGTLLNIDVPSMADCALNAAEKLGPGLSEKYLRENCL